MLKKRCATCNKIPSFYRITIVGMDRRDVAYICSLVCMKAYLLSYTENLELEIQASKESLYNAH